MKSCKIAWALNPMADVLVRTELFEEEVGHVLNETEARTGVATGQRVPRIADQHQMLGRGKEDSPLGSSEAAWSCQNLGFGVTSSRPVRQYVVLVFSHLVDGNFL